MARQLWLTPAVRVSGNGNGIPTTICAKTPSLPPLTVISPNEQTAANTHAFVASPELTLALTIAGDLCFNPLTDTLKTADGREVKLKEPEGTDFPPKGFEVKDNGYVAPTGKDAEVVINPGSNRLQVLKPFAAWDGKELIEMPLLLKAEGKCTTDHISMAGPWLRFRGHLENISTIC